MLSSCHTGMPERLLLGAGLFLTGFDAGASKNADDMRRRLASAVRSGEGVLGATRGGGTFSCVPMLRSLEEGARRTPSMGSMVLDGWLVRMTGTLVEITPDTLASLLPGAVIARQGCVSTLTLRGDIAEEDFLPTLCWIGDTPRGFVLIEMTAALNLAGAQLITREHGEGEMPFVFQAHSASWEDEDAPVRMLFFTEEDA